MKKVLLLAVLAAGGYYFYNKSQTTADDTTGAVASGISQWENKIIVDSKGYWLTVTGGKLLTVSKAMLEAWQYENPGAEILTIPQDIWEFNIGAHPELIGA